MVKLLTWDGTNLPEALRELPAGRYVVEPLDEPPALTSAEELGLEEALASLAHGEDVSQKEVRRRLRAMLEG